MKFLRVLHGLYAMVLFAISFLFFFILLLIPVVAPKQHHLVGVFNRWWAHFFFTVGLFPFKVEVRTPLNKKQQYIFCPNHFSYMDIPTMGLNPMNSIFVGKNDMEKIPLFGYMYRKLHITVDRASLKSRYTTLLRSAEAIDHGKNLTIFPEGGIVSQEPPKMGRFKDGAFRIAIEKQIPIIPVTIPYNWIILPDSAIWPKRGTTTVIFHEPISTVGMDLSGIEVLKKKTYDVIDAELKRHYDEDR